VSAEGDPGVTAIPPSGSDVPSSHARYHGLSAEGGREGQLTPLRVAIVQRFFPHYRKPVFDRIASCHDEVALELLCAMPEQPLAGAGIAIPVRREEVAYVAPVRNWNLRIGGHAVVFQPGVVWKALRHRYDVMVLEGAPHILTNLLLLRLLRVTKTRTVVWVKGWFGPGELDGWAGRLRTWMVRRADVCLCYGQETRRQLLDLGIDDDRIAINQNTVEVDHLLESPRGTPTAPSALDNPLLRQALASEATIVASIGRQTPDKRFEDLIAAFSEVSKRHPGSMLLLAGDGPGASGLRTMARVAGNPSIVLTGPLTEAESAALFLRSDVCAFPGAVGLALNEAMAAGCAVICADEPGPDSELCEHEVNGLRVAPGDHEALVLALERLVSDEGERHRLGRAARRTIAERATVDKMARSIVRAAVMASREPSGGHR
jgi:glycosyltransferase involved in cell wall biosynthesis